MKQRLISNMWPTKVFVQIGELGIVGAFRDTKSNCFMVPYVGNGIPKVVQIVFYLHLNEIIPVHVFDSRIMTLEFLTKKPKHYAFLAARFI